MARTVDNLRAMQAEDDARAIATQHQWPSTMVVAGEVEVEVLRTLSVRVGFTQTTWVEVYGGQEFGRGATE